MARDHALVQEPTAQIGQQLYLQANGSGRVSLPRKLVCVDNRKRPKWTRNPDFSSMNRHEDLPFLGKKGESVPSVRPARLCRFLRSDHRLPRQVAGGGRHNPELGIMNLAALDRRVAPEAAPDGLGER